MKIKEGYILDTIGEQKVAISVDCAEDKFHGMIKLNSVGAFLWECLMQEIDEAALIKAVTEKYDIDEKTAEKDIRKFVDQLEKNGILEN